MCPSPPPSASLFPNSTLIRATDSAVSPICVSGDSHPAPLSPDSDYEIVDVPPVDMGNITSQIDLSSFARGGVEVDPQVQASELPSIFAHSNRRIAYPIDTNKFNGKPSRLSPSSKASTRYCFGSCRTPHQERATAPGQGEAYADSPKVGKVLGETPTLAMVDKGA